MQTHLEPQKDHRQGYHSRITTCPLLVTGRHPAKLFQAVDQPFDLIALPIELAVKRPGGMLVLLPWNGGSDTPPVQVTAILAEGVSFIRRQAFWAQTHLATPPSDRPLFHQLLSHGDLVLLAGS